MKDLRFRPRLTKGVTLMLREYEVILFELGLLICFPHWAILAITIRLQDVAKDAQVVFVLGGFDE